MANRYAAGLAGMGLALLATLALRLIAPPGPPGVVLAWLLVTFAGTAAAACAAAMLVGLERGLREAWPPGLVRAGAYGSLAVGLAVAAVRGASVSEAFPDPALSLCALVSGLLMLASWLAPDSMPRRRGRSVAAVLGLFVVVDGALAVAIFVTPPPASSAWLLGVAASLTALSSARAPWFAAGLTASGLASLLIARAGSIDTLPGLLALAAGAGAAALLDRPPLATRHPRRQFDATLSPAVLTPEPDAAPPTAAATDGEGARLGRELRGTIAELLQARRTVELQRDEIMRLETRDPLTGLANRRAILERLGAEANEARRYAHPVAALLLDVDGFTRLNREHGMGVGDEVLREIGLRLRLRMRAADALGRIGADSFLVLLPHTDEAGAATFAGALLERLLSRPIETYDGEVTLAVSIGIAFVRPGMTFTADELLAEADAALASARAAGGNRIAFDRAHGLLRLDERRHAAPGTDAGRGRDANGGR